MEQLKGQGRILRRMTLAAAFLMPFCIAVIICADHGVYPFGDRCLLQVDMYHQYCPFFTEFMEKLKSGESLMYSWTVGLGSDFVALYAYYLASPLNWFLLLCPKGCVIEFMSLLLLLRIGLCGFTFAYYLCGHFRTAHPAAAVFGTAYALSAFMAAYAWNVMWTDCLVLAPLIVLGLERLVREKKAGLYYVTLAVSILSNYYISIMICVFLALYFLVLLVGNAGNRLGAAARFAWYSLLAGGTGAVLLLPEAVVLSESGSSGFSFPDSVEWYFNLVAELGRHCLFVTTYTGKEHWPNIYCGAFALFLIVLFVLNREIGKRRKICGLTLITIFVVSFANNYLDFLWHGLHFPDSLPGRQSFLYVFFLLTLCFEAFLHLRGNCVRHVLFALFADGVFLCAAYLLSDGELIGAWSFLFTGAFLAGYGALAMAWFLGNGRARARQTVFLLAALSTISELTVNFDLTGLDTVSRSAYVKNWSDYEAVLAGAKEAEEAEGEAVFYRTEELERKTKNDAALFGYYSATQFSSLMNISVSHIYQDLSMEGGKNFYCISGATPLVSAMLSVKYILADNALEENPLRTLVASSGDTYLYENKYVLPLGYMISGDVIAAWDYEYGSGVENQNELCYLLGASEDLLSVVPSESAPGVSTVTAEQDGYLFASYGSIDVDNLEEKVSDGRTRSFTKASHGYLLDLGYVHAGDVVEITNTADETVAITAYTLNFETLDTAYDALSGQTMTLTSFSDRKITGTIDVTEAGLLVFSIANEDGWSVYVDGEKVEKETFAEAFLSVSLTEGTHEILLEYTTPYLAFGAAVSALCLSLAAASLLVAGRLKKRYSS